ncbi:hypothetical protein E3N88_36379 [Mikania micrantha]|uniref:Uncharacterized protein n=1 Tax=Mikania micrantha TaxID=192012 RepID=A0A5N6M3L2_9ASTR|nr:hypothetical protein E3N88_36379 [Mikania micrantha]
MLSFPSLATIVSSTYQLSASAVEDSIKVQVEEENVLVSSGERKRDQEEKEGLKYVPPEVIYGGGCRRWSSVVLAGNIRRSTTKKWRRRGWRT